jgi:hypothetical protein
MAAVWLLPFCYHTVPKHPEKGRERVVEIDRRTKQIIRQYGVTDWKGARAV